MRRSWAAAMAIWPGADIWPDSTSHSLPPNISGPLVNQEHYSCTVHDSKKSVVLLNARVN